MKDKKSLKKTFFVYSTLFSFALLVGCGSGSSNSGDNVSTEHATVPTQATELQSYYKATAISPSSYYRSEVDNAPYLSSNSQAAISQVGIEKYITVVFNYNKVGKSLSDTSATDLDLNKIPAWDTNKTYSTAGNVVQHADGANIGIYSNKWWTSGNNPTSADVWKLIKKTNTSGTELVGNEAVETWNATSFYVGDSVIFHNSGTCYKAKYWTKDEPPKIMPTNDWETSWKFSTDCGTFTAGDKRVSEDLITKISAGATSSIGDKNVADEQITPIIPPVIPANDDDNTPPSPPPTPIDVVKDSGLASEAGSGLPAEGYEFLRTVTTVDWDWLFPLRSGKFSTLGGPRNMEPMASLDGSKDTFSLSNFKLAIIEYNSWAVANNYKQFLNEGTQRQQAQEFLIFWAKSSRETSGSWSTAKSPWIEDLDINGKITKVWKGGLYWVEEVGYSTDENTGESPVVNYVDAGSSFTPVANRSYYGRGIIQLSWNYNYGAFSAWMYDNGLFPQVITARNTLLSRPDYVATKGELSILSGIWFWMTPQGAKPSSHDVVFGDVSNISTSGQDQGLPQRNDGGALPTASGDTYDQSVLAFRIGTVINIVNGGLECNNAAKWHPGPMQRISYYNAYAAYFNSTHNLDVTLVDAAIDVWNDKIKDDSHDDLKMASCSAQKSYYGW